MFLKIETANGPIYVREDQIILLEDLADGVVMTLRGEGQPIPPSETNAPTRTVRLTGDEAKALVNYIDSLARKL